MVSKQERSSLMARLTGDDLNPTKRQMKIIRQEDGKAEEGGAEVAEVEEEENGEEDA
jgi:hypothetical protein